MHSPAPQRFFQHRLRGSSRGTLTHGGQRGCGNISAAMGSALVVAAVLLTISMQDASGAALISEHSTIDVGGRFDRGNPNWPAGMRLPGYQ
jgi:hypothetical protein